MVDMQTPDLAPAGQAAASGERKLPVFAISMIFLFLGTLGVGALFLKTMGPNGPNANGTAAPTTPVEGPVTTQNVPEKPAAPPSGTLTVESNIPCEITVEGKLVGNTGQSLTLPAGKHHVVLREPGSGAVVEGDVAVPANGGCRPVSGACYRPRMANSRSSLRRKRWPFEMAGEAISRSPMSFRAMISG
jgi:hypothetical protein